MPSNQGNVELLKQPLAQDLLRSKVPARLAYVWSDGTPRVIPIWFHWNGEEIVLGTPSAAPKTKAILDGSKVAITIDTESWPAKVLLIRGTARRESIDGTFPEYAAMAQRYFGEEGGRAWLERARGMFPRMVRVTVHPEWVGLLDFETRFPSAIEAAMTRGR